MITIKEIAKLMNVSPTTVANVIHGRLNKVSKENAEKIQQALREYNYYPKMGLEALTNKKTKIILVVAHMAKPYSHTLLCDPFYGYIIGLLEDYISQAGYYMMLYIKKTHEECDELIRNTAMSWNVSGIITLTFPYESYLRVTSQVECPVVGIDTYSDQGCHGLKTGYHVTLNDRSGGIAMGEYLIAKGFQNIKFVADVDIGSSYERMLGIQDVMTAHNLPFDPKKDFLCIDTSKEESFQQLHRFDSLVGKDCVLCCNSDQFAFTVVTYLIRMGWRIPEDFSICGYDDNIYATFTHPKLTTVHQNVSDKAASAFQILIRLMNDEEVEETVTCLPVEIVERDSLIK